MSRRGWLLFCAMSVIWGVPYLLIKVADEELTPAWVVFGRTALAALLLVPIAWRRGMLRPLLPKWHWLLVYSGVEIAGPWLLLSDAETRLSSSLSGLLIAAVPLIVAVIFFLVPAVSASQSAQGGHDDRLDRRRLLGLLVGLGGVAVLVGIDVEAQDAWAVVEVGLTALGYAIGPILIARKLSDLPALGVVASSVAVTALGYTPVAVLQAPDQVSGRVAASVVGLAVVCTAAAFVLFFMLIAEVGPARSTVITYVNPAVALLLGVLVLSEPFTAGIAIGFPLILAGCALATARNRQAAPVEAEPEAATAQPT